MAVFLDAGDTGHFPKQWHGEHQAGAEVLLNARHRVRRYLLKALNCVRISHIVGKFGVDLGNDVTQGRGLLKKTGE